MERVGDEGRRREKHRAMGVEAECENDVERRVWGALAARGGLLDCWSLVEVRVVGCVCEIVIGRVLPQSRTFQGRGCVRGRSRSRFLIELR
jgi:hypothetical protein